MPIIRTPEARFLIQEDQGEEIAARILEFIARSA